MSVLVPAFHTVCFLTAVFHFCFSVTFFACLGRAGSSLLLGFCVAVGSGGPSLAAGSGLLIVVTSLVACSTGSRARGLQ